MLHLQIVEQIKIRIQIVIVLERLQIAHRRSRLRLRRRLDHRDYILIRHVSSAVIGQEQSDTNSHQHGKRAASTGRRNHASHPA